MARELHERISSHVEATDQNGRTYRRFVLGRMTNAEVAADRVAHGDTNVAIVTVRETWRGANGKRTRQEISREPVTA